MNTKVYYVSGIVIVLITTLLGVLIALWNTPIYYNHSEIIYYPNEDKTYIEEYKVKQTIKSYILNGGVIQNNELIEFNKYEIELKEEL